MKLGAERNVKREIKKALTKLNVWHYMPSANVYGRGGIPDFICCLKGRFIAIEAKREKEGAKGLTPLQIMESKKILAHGGEYHVVWSQETLEKMRLRLELLTKQEK